MSINRQVIERISAEADDTVKMVLDYCQLEMGLVKFKPLKKNESGEPDYIDKPVLIIKCPNRFSADRLNGYLAGRFGKLISSLGISQVLLNDGDGFISYLEWNLIFEFKGYCLEGDPLTVTELSIPDFD